MHNIWYGHLARRLDERHREKAKYLVDGGAPDYPSYKFQVGYLQGLADALLEAEEVDREQMGMSPHAPRPTT